MGVALALVAVTADVGLPTQTLFLQTTLSV